MADISQVMGEEPYLAFESSTLACLALLVVDGEEWEEYGVATNPDTDAEEVMAEASAVSQAAAAGIKLPIQACPPADPHTHEMVPSSPRNCVILSRKYGKRN